MLHVNLLNSLWYSLPPKDAYIPYVYVSSSISVKLLTQKQTVKSAGCEFLKKAAFLRHNNVVNGHSLKSLSLLLINQLSLARSLVATKSHDHFIGQTMWGRKSFSISLAFTFVKL